VGDGDEIDRQGRQPPVGPRPQGYYTIRIAAVLFLLSAVVELVSVTTPVPWFGALRDGVPIVLYHLSVRRRVPGDGRRTVDGDALGLSDGVRGDGCLLARQDPLPLRIARARAAEIRTSSATSPKSPRCST